MAAHYRSSDCISSLTASSINAATNALEGSSDGERGWPREPTEQRMFDWLDERMTA
jgi:hypothetical protein